MPHGDAEDAAASSATAAPVADRATAASASATTGAAAAAGAAGGAIARAVGLSKPPLARKARAPRAKSTRNLKQREREFPDVDWDHTLQHFATCIYDDLQELNARFVSENDITFAAFKRLWLDARMSAAFHVEFWESTASNTHKTILQQALDALVICIENHSGEFEVAADVASLTGHVFALYCAYSVQLGDPKHKIDVDPRSWTTLLTISGVASGVGSVLFPQAAREVRAIMRRLVTTEDAFLRCLRGFGPTVRANHRTTAFMSSQIGSQQGDWDKSSVSSGVDEEEPPVKQEELKQLSVMSKRYQELVSRTRSNSTSAAGRGIRPRGRSTQHQEALQLGISVLQDGEESHEELIGALSAYAAYKANSEARRQDRSVRAAAAREYHTNNTLLFAQTTEHNGSLSAAVPPSPLPSSIASSSRRKRGESLGGDSDSFLAELELELHADIANDAIESPSEAGAQETEEQRPEEGFQADNQSSDTESDELEELELELQRNVGPLSPRHKGETVATADPSSRSKRAKASARVTSSKKNTPVLKAAASISTVRSRKQPLPQVTRRTRSSSVASNLSSTASWAVSSTGDSDGLAALQAELDSLPSLKTQDEAAVPTTDCGTHATRMKTKPATTSAAPVQQRTVEAGIQSRVTHAPTLKRAGDITRKPRASTKRQQKSPKQLPPSVALEGSGQLSRSKSHPDTVAQPQASRTPRVLGVSRESNVVDSAEAAEPYQPPVTRRSARLSSIASDTESDGLADLEAELASGPGPLTSTLPVPPALASETEAKKPRKKVPAAGKRPAQHKTEVKTTNLLTVRRSSRLSSIASESDGLEELEAELATFAALPVSTSSTQPALASKTDTKRPKQRAAATRKRPARRVATAQKKVKTTKQQQTATGNSVPTLPDATQRDVAVESSLGVTRTGHVARPTQPQSVWRSSRLSSVASDIESDGLAELEAELNASIPPSVSVAYHAPATAPKTKVPNKSVSSTLEQSVRKATTATKRPVQQVATARKKAKTTGDTDLAHVDAVRHKVAEEASTATELGDEAASTSLRNIRRSSRLRSVASDTESDGLAELEAELNSSISPSATGPAMKSKSPGNSVSSTPKQSIGRGTAVRSQATKTRKTTPSNRTTPVPRARRTAGAASAAAAAAAAPQPDVSSNAYEPQLDSVASVRRSTRLSSVASDMESDGLAELEAELGSAPTPVLVPAPTSTTKRQEPAAPADSTGPKRAIRRVSASKRKTKQSAKESRGLKGVITVSTVAPVNTPTGEAVNLGQQTATAGRSKSPSVLSSPRQLRTRRSTRSSSVASDTESDGLAELEAELQAVTG